MLFRSGDYNTVDFNHVRDCGRETVYEGLYLAAGSHNAFRFNTLYNCPMAFHGADTIDQGNVSYSTEAIGPNFTSVTREGDHLVMSWPAGELEAADAPDGPWTAVPDARNSARVPMVDAHKFFRVRRSEQ